MKACVVGYGSIGALHAEILSELESAELCAVCDSDTSRADRGAAGYGIKAYYNYDECLLNKSIDVVHICTPHFLHFEMICKALDAGKKVVVEKPAVMTEDEFKKILSDYNVSDVYPVFQNRKNTCIEELKKIVSTDKTLGKAIGAKGILTWTRDASYYAQAPWRSRILQAGGGVLINQALHTLDLMMYFMGPAGEISASGHNRSLKEIIEVEDTVDAFIKYKSGAKGVFYATNAYCQNSPMQFEIEFENRSFKYFDGMLISGREVICRDSSDTKGKDYWGSSHSKAFAEFYENKTSFCLSDIKDTMNAMFAIYRSINEQKTVIL